MTTASADTVQGEILRDEIIPPKEYLGVELRKGQVLRIVDVEGQQVPDVVFFNLDNPKEKLSTNNTMLILKKWRVTTGDPLISDEGNDMVTIVDDTVGGVHHLSGGCCNEPANWRRYGVRGTRNCRSNIAMAAASLGITEKEVPGVIAPFMNVVRYPDGRYEIELPPSKAGDYLDFRAEMDVLAAISNCPQEKNPCNGFNPTPLRVVVYQPG